MDKVLLVEDDPFIAESLTMTLRLAGFETTHAPTLSAADVALARNTFAAIVLDLNLPDGSGFDFCTRFREKDADLPVVILTARTDEDSAVKGFASGATDYIRKPFGSNELIARLRRLMNRDPAVAKTLSFGSLVLSTTDRRALCDGKELTLTRREFDLLVLLVKRTGGLLSKEQILSAIDQEGELFEGTIATHISNLRTKLKKGSGGTLTVGSVYGQGYRLEKA